jgi:GNAT superfamily N-acetyltransferase
MSVRATLHPRERRRSRDLIVKAAKSGDVAAVFNLNRAALGSRYLKYTIYHSSESVSEIKKIVDHREPGNEIFILNEEDRLAGYYHGILTGEEYQLNYIAVRSDARARGLGSFLLDHFHSRALRHGCTHTS